VHTDDYPNEVGWTIEKVNDDGNDTEMFAITDGTWIVSGSYSHDVGLPPGEYRFTITDTQSDGICCKYGEGSYEVTDDAGTVLTSGDAFGASASITFTLT